MASVSQLPAEFNIEGAGGAPFSLVVNIAATDSDDNPVAFSDPAAVVTGQDNAAFAAGLPTATQTDDAVQILWDADATTAIMNAGRVFGWALGLTLDEDSHPIIAGTLQMFEPTKPGVSTSGAVTAVVQVGTMTVNVSLTVAGGGSGGGSGDGTITSVNGQEGPVVTLGAADVGADAAGAASAALTSALAAVASEATRATTAEGTKASTSALTAETTRATTAEGVNATAIAAETTRAEGVEATNATAIAAETTRAETAEGTKASSSALSAETTRATTAEGVNATAIAAETTRAEGVETTNAAAIAAEITRATTAEGTKASSSALTAEVARAEAAEAALAGGADLPLSGGTMTGPIAMGGSKVTGLAAGTVSTDAATIGQLPPPGKVSGFMLVAHSWGTGVGVPTNDRGRGTMAGRLAGLTGAHEDNIVNLAIAGTYLTQIVTAITSTPLAGWAGVYQFSQPSESAVVAESGWPGQNVNGTSGLPTFFIDHVNDIGAAPLSWATQGVNAYENTLIACVSRRRAGAWYGCSSPQGTLTWDPTIAFSSGWTNVASVLQNSGAGYASAAANGKTVTVTLPAVLPPAGGVLGISLMGPATGYALVGGSGIAASGLGNITIAGNSTIEFSQFRSGQFPVIVDSEQILVTFTNATTLAMVARGFNGTTAAAHSSSAVLQDAKNANVTWSGTASGVPGSPTFLAQQSMFGGQNPVVTRIPFTGADAGKTIILTTAGMVTASGTPSSSDTCSLIIFDSWWVESNNPAPVVLNQLPRSNYYSNLTPPTWANINLFNAMLATVAALFDSTVQVDGADAIFFARTATLATAINSSVTSIAVTANGTGFPTGGGNRITIWAPGDAHAEDVLVQSVTGTFPNYTCTVVRGYNGSVATAHGTANSQIADASLWHTDNVHPAPEGQAIIAQTLGSALGAALPSVNTYEATSSQGSWIQGTETNTPGVIDNFSIGPPISGITQNSVTENQYACIPIFVPEPCILVGLQFNLHTAGATGAVYRLGCHLPNGGAPRVVLADFGTVAVDGATGVKTLSGIYRRLDPGWYFFGGVAQGQAGTQPSITSVASGGLSWPPLSVATMPTTALGPSGYLWSGVTGAIGQPTAAPVNTTQSAPIIYLIVRAIAPS